jgi:hypothetical protein
MSYNQERFERFAMQAETMEQKQGPSITGIKVDDAGTALGYSRDESREIARQLHDEEWAIVDFGGGEPTLKLTRKGYQEIAKLHWPAWKKWLDRHPKTVAAFLGALGGLIVNLILRFF